METNRICLNQTFTSIILYTGVVYWSCKGRIHTFSVDTARKRCSLKLFKYTWLRNISAYVTQVHTPRLHKRHNCAYVTFAHTSQLRKRHICANITFAQTSHLRKHHICACVTLCACSKGARLFDWCQLVVVGAD